MEPSSVETRIHQTIKDLYDAAKESDYAEFAKKIAPILRKNGVYIAAATEIRDA